MTRCDHGRVLSGRRRSVQPPAPAAKWLFTSPTSESHSTDLDVRVGGAWTIIDRREGVDYRAIGQYLEVDRPRRLVFTFDMPQFAEGFARLTVEIAADGTGALMTLTQEDVPAGGEAGLEEGWSAVFEAMAGLL